MLRHQHEVNQEEYKEESINLIEEAENDCLGENLASLKLLVKKMWQSLTF